MPTINNRFENLTLERLQEIYDLIITPGSLGLSVGVTPITGGAVGRILFEGAGNVLQESSNLFWDNVNNRLGIGTATPAFSLDVNGSDARINTLTIGLGSGQIFNNTAVGTHALFENTTGAANTAVGYFALENNTTGSNNSAFGYASLLSNLSTSNHTAIGLSSLRNITSGSYNTALGTNAGRYIADGTTNLTTSNVSLFLGSNTKALANSQTNQIVIGYDATGLGSNSVVLGNSSITLTALRGNVLINTTTDAGYRLDVNGTARIQGTVTITPTANTSAIVSTGYSVTGSDTTAMLSFNGTVNTTGNVTPYIFDVTHTASGSGSFLAQFKRNGSYLWGIGLNDGLIYSTNHVSITGAWQIFARENAINGVVIRSTNPSTHTSGSRNHFSAQESFAPTSGTGTYTSILSSPTINQTGGANGITRGLYIQPVLTAAADWRAIEVSSGGAYINTTSVAASAILQADSTTKGFLPPRMTTAQRDAISSPATGLRIFNTTTSCVEYFDSFWGWMPVNANSQWYASYGMDYFNDGPFADGVIGIGTTGTGASLNTGANVLSLGQGNVTFITGTTSTGICRIASNTPFVLGNGRIVNEYGLLTVLLSTSTERYVNIIGFQDVYGINQSDGAYFLYDEGGITSGSTATPNFQCVTSSNSVRTFTTTSVVNTAGVLRKFRIEINDAATQVLFYINNVLVATHTTNIPVGAARSAHWGVLVQKQVGTTSIQAVCVDYYLFKQKWVTAR